MIAEEKKEGEDKEQTRSEEKERVTEEAVLSVKQLIGSAYQKKVDELKNHVLMLRISMSQIQSGADATENDAEAWLKRASEALEGASQLIELGERAKKRYNCFGLLPNLKARRDFCKEAERKARDLVRIEREWMFDKVRNESISKQRVENIPVSESYLSLPSRESVFLEVMDALESPDYKMVGVYGIGGVGKTTLAKQIYAMASRRKLFDAVIMTNVNERRIQTEIAEAPGRKLVILDNAEKPFHIEDVVGVAIQEGSKMLLISRNRHVLSAMNTQRDIMLGLLTEKEAWLLFKTVVGDLQSPELLPIANQIVRGCAGLPGTIVRVARACKAKDLQYWGNTLEQLSLSEEGFLERIIYQRTKSSYDQLSGYQIWSLFLLCGVLDGPHISILDLAAHGLCLNILPGKSVQDAINKTRELIDDLIASSLLVHSKYDGFVEMHDVARTLAIVHASKHHKLTKIRSQEVKERLLRLILPGTQLEDGRRWNITREQPGKTPC